MILQVKYTKEWWEGKGKIGVFLKPSRPTGPTNPLPRYVETVNGYKTGFLAGSEAHDSS
jgi:hypothetical protein